MEHPTTSIRRGIVWLGSAVLLGRVVDLISLGAVLWFVTDRGLGEATIAWSVSAFVEAISGNGLGLGTAVLQNRQLTQRQIRSAFWFSVATAIVIAVGLSAVAPLVERMYRAHDVTTFLRIYALRHVAVGIACIPVAWLNGEMRYRDVAATQTIATIVAACVRVGVSIRWGGAWGLVLAHVAQGVTVAAAALALSQFRPGRRFDFEDVRPMLHFGIRIIVAELAFQLFRNVDFMLVGYLLGVGPLGLYRIAFDVAMEVAIPLADLVSRSVTPVLARLEVRSAELRETFFFAIRTLGFLLTPVLVGLYAIMPDLLALVAKGRFVAATSTGRLLVIAAGMRVIYQLYRPFYIATGRATVLLRMELLALAVLSSILAGCLALLGPSMGVFSAGIGWVATYPCLTAAGLAVARTIEGIRPLDYLRAVARGISSLPVLAIVAAVVTFSLPANVPPAYRLVACAAAVILAHVAFLKFALGVNLRGMLAPRGA